MGITKIGRIEARKKGEKGGKNKIKQEERKIFKKSGK
jgi:hypothetical protein